MTYDRPINIMLVDDHAMLREGVRGLLATSPIFRVVAEAAGTEKALSKVRDYAVDLVVTDLEMPRSLTNGIELTQQLRAAFPALRVLIYTMHRKDKYIFQAIEAGAHGYVLKEESGTKLMNAIKKIVNGQTDFPSIVPDLESLLTPAERQVLWLLGKAKSNASIAAELSILEHTVEGYRSRIWQKLRPVVQIENSENEAIKFIQFATKYAECCLRPSKSKIKD